MTLFSTVDLFFLRNVPYFSLNVFAVKKLFF